MQQPSPEERRFQELLEAAPDAILEVDGEGRIMLLNGMAEKLFGYQRDELLGQPVSTLIPEQPGARQARHPAQYWLHPALEGRRKDGARFPVEISLSPTKSLGATVVIRDIRGRKQAENRLRTIQETYIAQLRALGGSLQKAREEERKTIARTIHDELGQALTCIKMDLSRLKQELPAERRDWAEISASILEQVDRTLRSVRRMATELRPGILDDLGLAAAMEWAAEEFEGRTKTRCRLRLPESELEADPEQATALFRIFQETLTNIMRHANATQVDVNLARVGADLILEVRDNGRGIDEDRISASDSFGILGMRERALLLGGEFSIHGAAGGGTTVRVRIPLAGAGGGGGFK